MKTTIEFLDAVKARHSLQSDYALAPVLGVTRSAISKLRNRKDFLGDTTAIRVSELLEIDASYVLACAHAERSKGTTEKAAWMALAERLGGLAASVVLGLALFSPPSPAAASIADDLYYVKKPRRHKKIKFCPV